MESSGRRVFARCALAAVLAACMAVAAPGAAQGPSAPAPAISAGREAFLDGYRAYQNRDYGRAEQQLAIASANFPELADYALFYLASAQRDSGNLTSAAATFASVAADFPQSVLAGRAQLETARALLKLGRFADASGIAAHLAVRTSQPELEQQARLVETKAEAAAGDWRAAYDEFMALRDKYPRAATDSEARAGAYAILSTHPSVADTSSLSYHRAEAELLLRENERALALSQAERALAMAPAVAVRASLLWIEAQALRFNPGRRKGVLLEYLRIAPRGPAAPEVLEALGLLYWHDKKYLSARIELGRIVSHYPWTRLAARAMLRIGRILEDQGRYDAARGEYRRLAARYPESESAAQARFRGPWTYYMTHRYRSAATAFGFARARTHDPSERDRDNYWRARALESAGEHAQARALLKSVASSTASNYYPALASRRVTVAPPDLPAAHVSNPSIYPAPAVAGPAKFHLSRALTLTALGLKELLPDELRALERPAASDPDLRNFVLAGFERSGAWYDAIVTAMRMERRGHISRALAERVRYPLAWWNLLKRASEQRGLDPYLLLALTRQESLFNPGATSVSGARGLMQLMPSTADKVARQSGIAAHTLDLYDPALNVELGTSYLKSLLELYGGDEVKAVAAYNGGEHAVERWMRKYPGTDDEWVENIEFRETRQYVKKVIGGRREYRLLYGPSAPSPQTAGAGRPPA
jgi:peptidoglycan lytic transglycosylase